MGGCISSLACPALASFSRHFRAKPCRILVLGLDTADKTTLLFKLNRVKIVTTVPTIDCNVEILKYKNIELTSWDLGGAVPRRPPWRIYLQNTDAVIYVIDASDRERIDEATEELRRLFEYDELRDAKLLVYANKQDLPGAMTIEEIQAALNVDAVTKSAHHVESTVVTTGSGVYEGLDWLYQVLIGQVGRVESVPRCIIK